MLRWINQPGGPDMFTLGAAFQELRDLILENRRLQMTADDQLATALSDLGTAVANAQAKTEAATSEISTLVQQLLVASGKGEQDKITAAAARIEELVGDINAGATQLGDAVAGATTPPTVSTSLSTAGSTTVSTSLSTVDSTAVSSSLSTVGSTTVSTSLSTAIDPTT